MTDPKVTVGYVQIDGSIASTALDEQPLTPVALREDVMNPLRRVSAEFWPGMPVLPNSVQFSQHPKMTTSEIFSNR